MITHTAPDHSDSDDAGKFGDTSDCDGILQLVPEPCCNYQVRQQLTDQLKIAEATSAMSTTDEELIQCNSGLCV